MTVYVDDMRAPFRRMIMCHMIADTEEELHSMAAQIGVARRWYQGNHYDICASMRAKAVKLGAVEITMRECSALVRRAAVTGKMGSPKTAVAWLREYLEKRRELAHLLAEKPRRD